MDEVDGLHHTVAHAVVVSGASPITPAAARFIPRDALVIAADSGWDRAREIGLRPQVLVGDMDSIPSGSLDEATSSGATIIRHATDKDFTDIELALAHAASRSRRVTLISGGGGRLDHAFAEILALTSSHLRGCRVDALIGAARVHVVNNGSSTTIDARVGSILSLVAVGGPAHRTTLTGCKWNVSNATFTPHESRGVSNVVTTTPVSLSVGDGCIVAIEPFYLEETS